MPSPPGPSFVHYKIGVTWKPISREYLDAMIADGLAAYDEDVRKEWDRIKIEPEKWRCSPWGDAGGGFWVVAIRDSEVLWYNDIEQGFNVSPFSQHGVIDEYYCDQTAFSEILEHFAQAQSDRAWSALVPGDIPAEVLGAGTIIHRQTTYLDLRAWTGRTCRVHFRDKVEFAFRELDYPSVVLVDNHPLLMDYTQPSCVLYIAGERSERSGVVAQIAQAIHDATQGWRALADYTHHAHADSLVRDGYGLFMNGPRHICEVVAGVLEAADLRCSILGRATETSENRVLLLGESYVIAREFAFELRT